MVGLDPGALALCLLTASAVEKDQLLLLLLEHVCVRDGVSLPWDAVGMMLTPQLTSEAIKQHLAKVRKARQAEGLEVPPALDKSQRRRIKQPSNHHALAVSVQPQEEGPKRSTLLPPRKPSRRGAKKAPAGKKRAGTKSVTEGAISPLSMQGSVQTADSSSQPQYVVDGSPYLPLLAAKSAESIGHVSKSNEANGRVITADQLQLLQLDLARAEQSRLEAMAKLTKPRMTGFASDVFLGVGGPVDDYEVQQYSTALDLTLNAAMSTDTAPQRMLLGDSTSDQSYSSAVDLNLSTTMSADRVSQLTLPADSISDQPYLPALGLDLIGASHREAASQLMLSEGSTPSQAYSTGLGQDLGASTMDSDWYPALPAHHSYDFADAQWSRPVSTDIGFVGGFAGDESMVSDWTMV